MAASEPPLSVDPPRPLRAVTFDATGTLIHSPRLGEIYAEVLARHGLVAAPERVVRTVPVVFQELACRTDGSRDRFSSHPEGARGWWRRFVERLAEHLGLAPPSRFAAAELFDRFARADAWEVYPDVVPALERLRRRGLALGVVANWDERLPGVLEGLDLARFFEAVVVSSAIGYEKPDPRIFLAALERLGVAPEEALHVGDRRREDVEGAIALGMAARHLDREGGEGLEELTRGPAA